MIIRTVLCYPASTQTLYLASEMSGDFIEGAGSSVVHVWNLFSSSFIEGAGSSVVHVWNLFSSSLFLTQHFAQYSLSAVRHGHEIGGTDHVKQARNRENNISWDFLLLTNLISSC
jgi:hypothetical protein